LDRLLAERTPSPEFGLVTVGMAGTLASAFWKSDPIRATRYLMEGIRASRDVEMLAPTLKRKGVDLGQELMGILWMTGAGINDDDQFDHWFTAVQELTADEVRHWAGSEFAEKVSELVCNGIWMRSADASGGTQDWTGVVNRLERLRTWARTGGVIPLL